LLYSIFVFVLSLVFFVSGISKLSSINSFRETLMLLNVPKKYSFHFGFSFALCEMIVAIGVLLDSYRSYFLFAMLLITICLLFVVSLSIKKNQRIKCNCFGNLTNEIFGFGVLSKIIVLLLMIIYSLFNGGYLWGSTYYELMMIILFSVQIFLAYIALIIIINLKQYRK